MIILPLKQFYKYKKTSYVHSYRFHVVRLGDRVFVTPTPARHFNYHYDSHLPAAILIGMGSRWQSPHHVVTDESWIGSMFDCYCLRNGKLHIRFNFMEMGQPFQKLSIVITS